ncbi:hypothetical protein [Kitasatospora sp. NPDC085464]|uniref:hypothetical protein n=1 Tax=Kitasatospora sp. NPDC085464 TaxID=3364063 RepID=UPI0037C61245
MSVKYTRELLASLAAESSSVNEMMRRLGVPMAGGTHSYLSRRFRDCGIDTSHFTEGCRAYRQRPYSKELLAEAAAAATTLDEMLIALDRKPNEYNRKYLRQRIKAYGIDTTHFPAPGTVYTKELLQEAVAACHSVAGVVRHLHKRQAGGTQAHIGRRIKALGIDTSHFTGQAHRPDNLRLLCPNCHAVTDTYCGRNKNKRSAPPEIAVFPPEARP